MKLNVVISNEVDQETFETIKEYVLECILYDENCMQYFFNVIRGDDTYIEHKNGKCMLEDNIADLYMDIICLITFGVDCDETN